MPLFSLAKSFQGVRPVQEFCHDRPAPRLFGGAAPCTLTAHCSPCCTDGAVTIVVLPIPISISIPTGAVTVVVAFPAALVVDIAVVVLLLCSDRIA